MPPPTPPKTPSALNREAFEQLNNRERQLWLSIRGRLNRGETPEQIAADRFTFDWWQSRNPSYRRSEDGFVEAIRRFVRDDRRSVA